MKQFIKTKEDFVCEKCVAPVKGNGYTNHCPKCLWGKHVDVNPGDRAEGCGGMMKPIALETEKGAQKIIHRCVRCGFTRRQTTSPGDDFDALLRI